jgi:PPOX class probable F420-dependent enzyme
MTTMTPEQEAFLREHRFCVLSTVGRSGAPQVTRVYYLYEGGKLLTSVTRDRIKTHNVLRDPQVAVCALHEERPFSFVQVMGKAAITEEDLVETSRRIWSRFRSELPEDFAQVMVDQKRVVMVVTPERVSSGIGGSRSRG